MGWIIGTSCQIAGRRRIWQIVDHLNATQARTAARRLEQIRRDHVLYADILQEQEWDDQAGLQTLMRGPGWPSNFLSETSHFLSAEAVNADRWAALRIRLTGKRRIMASYTAYMDQAIANTRRPYAAHLIAPAIPTDLVSQVLLASYTNGWAEELDSHTQNGLLLTALALHTYKLEHGAYPPNLAALVPCYLQAVPNDPFALSGPLRYRRTGAKYLLYSVGPDGKDDDGTAIFDKTKPAPTDLGKGDPRYLTDENSRGDIVAGVNP